jgi:hypothetical protein
MHLFSPGGGRFPGVAALLEQSRQPMGRVSFRGKKETYGRLFETEIS